MERICKRLAVCGPVDGGDSAFDARARDILELWARELVDQRRYVSFTQWENDKEKMMETYFMHARTKDDLLYLKEFMRTIGRSVTSYLEQLYDQEIETLKTKLLLVHQAMEDCNLLKSVAIAMRSEFQARLGEIEVENKAFRDKVQVGLTTVAKKHNESMAAFNRDMAAAQAEIRRLRSMCGQYETNMKKASDCVEGLRVALRASEQERDEALQRLRSLGGMGAGPAVAVAAAAALASAGSSSGAAAAAAAASAVAKRVVRPAEGAAFPPTAPAETDEEAAGYIAWAAAEAAAMAVEGPPLDDAMDDRSSASGKSPMDISGASTPRAVTPQQQPMEDDAPRDSPREPRPAPPPAAVKPAPVPAPAPAKAAAGKEPVPSAALRPAAAAAAPRAPGAVPPARSAPPPTIPGGRPPGAGPATARPMDRTASAQAAPGRPPAAASAAMASVGVIPPLTVPAAGPSVAERRAAAAAAARANAASVSRTVEGIRGSLAPTAANFATTFQIAPGALETMLDEEERRREAALARRQQQMAQVQAQQQQQQQQAQAQAQAPVGAGVGLGGPSGAPVRPTAAKPITPQMLSEMLQQMPPHMVQQMMSQQLPRHVVAQIVTQYMAQRQQAQQQGQGQAGQPQQSPPPARPPAAAGKPAKSPSPPAVQPTAASGADSDDEAGASFPAMRRTPPPGAVVAAAAAAGAGGSGSGSDKGREPSSDDDLENPFEGMGPGWNPLDAVKRVRPSARKFP